MRHASSSCGPTYRMTSCRVSGELSSTRCLPPARASRALSLERLCDSPQLPRYVNLADGRCCIPAVVLAAPSRRVRAVFLCELICSCRKPVSRIRYVPMRTCRPYNSDQLHCVRQAGYSLGDEETLLAAMDPVRWLQHSSAPLPKLRVGPQAGSSGALTVRPPVSLDRVSAASTATSEFSAAGASLTSEGAPSLSDSFPAASQASQVLPARQLTDQQSLQRHENGGAGPAAAVAQQGHRPRGDSAQEPSWQLPPRSRSQLTTGKLGPPTAARDRDAAAQAAILADHDGFLFDVDARSPPVPSYSMGPLASAAVRLHTEPAPHRTRSDAGARCPPASTLHIGHALSTCLPGQKWGVCIDRRPVQGLTGARLPGGA